MRTICLFFLSIFLALHGTALVPAQQKQDAQVSYGGIEINPAIGYVIVRDIRIMNPVEFSERVMVLISSVHINYNEYTMLLKGVKHFSTIRAEIGEVNVIRNKAGKFNFEPTMELLEKGGQQEKEKKGGAGLKIDKLELKIGKLVYKDYSTGEKPVIVVFKANFNETYTNITDPAKLAEAISGRLLDTASIESVENLDIGDIPGLVASAWDAVPDTTKARIFGKSKDLPKKIGAFGKRIARDFKKLGK